MIGFFQKETFELKRAQTTKSVLKPASSGETSYISFNRNEANQIAEQDLHSKRHGHTQPYGVNKSYSGFPLNNESVFPMERLSVTRLLEKSRNE